MWRTFFTSMTQFADQPLVTVLDQGISQSIAFVATWIVYVMAICIAFWAISLAAGLRGGPNEVAGIARVLFRMVFVVALLSTANYTYWIRDTVWTAGPDAVNQMTGQQIGSVSHSYDVTMNMAFDSMWSVWNSVRTVSLRIILFALLVVVYVIAALAAIFCGYGIWALGHVLSVVYLVIGPVALPCLLAKTTRPIALAWLGATLSCVVMQALSVILTVVVVKVDAWMLGQIVTDTSSSPAARAGMLLAAAGMFGLFAFIAKHIPAMAMQLCGGVHYMPYALTAATYGVVQSGASTALGYTGKFLVSLPSRIVGPPQSPGSQQGPAVPPGQSLSKAYK